ncbi:MAG: hypothetical protein HQ572_04985 [Candidatus Omnitrophica bacterium]|nr:hypothetical protein [Candidatus Omnitrophota bacterium]
MEKLKNMEKLPVDAGKRINVYMQEMLKMHEGNVASIFIYGSAGSEDYVAGTSDINSAVVFKDLRFTQLNRSLRLVDKGIRKGMAAPLFLTPEYIKSSSDTFPIEFLEMKENHILVYGEDLLSDLEIEPSHIRFICEEQIKGKLIRIRQAYLEVGLRKKGMEALIKESLNSLFPVFRGLLRLKGITPPIKKEEAVRLLAEIFGIDPQVFIAVLRDKKNDEKIGGENLESFLEKYIAQIEKLADIADQL